MRPRDRAYPAVPGLVGDRQILRLGEAGGESGVDLLDFQSAVVLVLIGDPDPILEPGAVEYVSNAGLKRCRARS